jgi:hypothetical protein
MMPPLYRINFSGSSDRVFNIALAGLASRLAFLALGPKGKPGGSSEIGIVMFQIAVSPAV